MAKKQQQHFISLLYSKAWIHSHCTHTFWCLTVITPVWLVLTCRLTGSVIIWSSECSVLQPSGSLQRSDCVIFRHIVNLPLWLDSSHCWAILVQSWSLKLFLLDQNLINNLLMFYRSEIIKTFRLPVGGKFFMMTLLSSFLIGKLHSSKIWPDCLTSGKGL